MKRLILTCGFLCACAVATQGASGDKKKRIEAELRGVPRPELAAKVAEIVRLSPPHERAEAAAIAVATITERHPAAADAAAAAAAKAVASEHSALNQSKPGARPSTPPDETVLTQQSNGKGNKETDQDNGNRGNGNGNSNAGGNGGVGLGPGPNKPGKVIVDDKPINTVLPNGKPRHFPPDPPRRPVDPPRPIKYNRPRN